jgi:hypothetical protein
MLKEQAMKLEGEIVSVEYLRGGVSIGIRLERVGELLLHRLTDEQAMGYRAGGKVTVDVSVEVIEEELEEKPLEFSDPD